MVGRQVPRPLTLDGRFIDQLMTQPPPQLSTNDCSDTIGMGAYLFYLATSWPSRNEAGRLDLSSLVFKVRGQAHIRVSTI